jgi:hypothetical protein
MKEVKLSERTLERLFHHARSFDDDVETVLERVLDEIEARGSSADFTGLSDEPRDESEDLLAETAYWVPILELLVEAGGSARGSAVIDALEGRLGAQFTRSDHRALKTGEVRWRNRARFARLRMKEGGLVSANSPRGVWEITPAGVAYLNEHRELEGRLVDDARLRPSSP